MKNINKKKNKNGIHTYSNMCERLRWIRRRNELWKLYEARNMYEFHIILLFLISSLRFLLRRVNLEREMVFGICFSPCSCVQLNSINEICLMLNAESMVYCETMKSINRLNRWRFKSMLIFVGGVFENAWRERFRKGMTDETQGIRFRLYTHWASQTINLKAFWENFNVSHFVDK